MYYNSVDPQIKTSIVTKLAHLHTTTKMKYPEVSRIAVALYDQETDIVRTFIYSGKPSPLNHYQAHLSDCHSLKQLALSNQARIEQDLSVFSDSEHLHAIKIYEAGYRSSYTLPLISGSTLLGYLF